MKRLAAMMVALVVLCVSCPDVWSQESETPGPFRNMKHEKHLKALNWFVGDWELKGQLLFADKTPQDFVYQKRSEWTLGNNFLSTTTTDGSGHVVHKSMVGWDPERREIKEWGFWSFGYHEVVVWSPQKGKRDKWLITREGLKGVYTVLGQDKYRYEAEFRGDDGKMNRWHFTAERK